MNRVNYAAVIVAGIVFWIIEAGWYTLLSKPYIAALGMTPEQVAAAQSNVSFVPYLTALLSNCVIAYVIAIIMLRTGGASAQHGAMTALVLWMGFVATVLATTYSFEQRPFSLFAINSGAMLLGMIACGAIVGAWKGKAPATSAAGA